MPDGGTAAVAHDRISRCRRATVALPVVKLLGNAHTAPAPCTREGVAIGDLIEFGLATVVTRILPSRYKGKSLPSRNTARRHESNTKKDLVRGAQNTCKLKQNKSRCKEIETESSVCFEE